MTARRYPWPVWAALALVCLLAYANSFHAGFPFDNKGVIVNDARVQEFTWKNLGAIFAKPYWWPRLTNEYRPLTTLTYLFNRAVSGDNAVPFHIVNLAFHYLTAILVWRLGLRWLPSSRAAVFAAVLFAVHPVATEAVTNIIGRADLMAAAAVLGALLLHACVAEASAARRTRYLAAFGVVALAGVFAKENALILPVVMLIYDLARGRKGQVFFYKPSYAVAVGACALYGVARWMVYSDLPPVRVPFTDNPLTGADFLTARLTALHVLGKYLGLLVWPQNLSCDYSYNQIPLAGWADPGALAAAAVLAALAALAVVSFRRNRAVFFYLALLFAALAPTANLARIIGSVMAERFLYLPLAAFAALAVLLADWAAARVARARAVTVANAVLTLAAVAWCGRTLMRNPDWRDEVSLWTSAVRVSPASYRAHKALAAAWFNSSPASLADRMESVIAEASEAGRILDPLPASRSDYRAYLDLGMYLRVQGDFLVARGAAAEGYFRRSAETLRRAAGIAAANREADAAPFLQLGLACTRLGDLENARMALAKAQDLSAADPMVYFGMAEVAERTGDPQRAIKSYYKALTLGFRHPAVGAGLNRLYQAMGLARCAGVELGRNDQDCPELRHYVCAAMKELAVELQQRNHAAYGRRLAAAAAGDPVCAAAR
ncbi:MAG: protein O-mannosyl-transferase TMTC1-related protein [Bryobacteraceae bacterium]